MIAIKAREHRSGDFAPCWNHPEAVHIPGRYPTLTKRYLPPPRMTPRGGFNERENFQDRKPVHGYLMRYAEVFRPDAGEEREMFFPVRCSAVDTTTRQVIRRYRNLEMPTQRGLSPQERQTLVQKRTQGCDFNKESAEIEGARS
jgi:hypothetical protein